MLTQALGLIINLLMLLAGCQAFIGNIGDLLKEFGELGINVNTTINIPERTLRNNAEYDYIIVGAGSAGSVLANRLSEKYSVAVLEAGGSENFLSRIPAMCGYAQLTDMNWRYYTTPQKCGCRGLNNQQCPKAAGKVLGGGSSLNLMLYSRGTKADHDCPKLRHNIPNWDHDTLWPYILKSEKAMNMNGFESTADHNQNGKVTTRHTAFQTAITQSYFDGMQELGISYLDYNGQCILGISEAQTTTNKQGQRFSTFRGYVEPLLWNIFRKLSIFTRATVTEILYNPTTKVVNGVKFKRLGQTYTFKARREVILSAGVFGSAKLLMLSGIGPKSCLDTVNIPQRHDLPVGKGIKEHTAFASTTITLNTTGQSMYLSRISPLDIVRYALLRNDNTRLSVPFGTVESLGFFKLADSTNPKDTPDFEFLFSSGSYISDYGTGLLPAFNLKQEVYDKYYLPLIVDRENRKLQTDHFMLLISLSHPHSQGYMCLNSNDANDPPLINPNILGDQRDMRILYRANKLLLQLVNTEAMRKLDAKVFPVKYPGCEQYEFGSKCYWKCFIRHNQMMYNHELGTCRMGCQNDPRAVVNSKLCVFGMKNLRVVDNSVWPCTTSGHTNYMAMMIAERAADFILQGQCDGSEENECVYQRTDEDEAEDAKIGVSDCDNECLADDEVDDESDNINLLQCGHN